MKKSLLALALLIPTIAFADTDYLAEFRMGGKAMGQVPIYEKQGVYYADPVVFDKLKLPIKVDTPISVLEQYGTIEFNRVNQVLVFTPNNIDLFLDKKKVVKEKDVKTVEAKDFDLKGVDYQASVAMANKLQFGFLGTATGRIYNFDVDGTYTTAGDHTTGLLQWHKETNPWIKDISIGTVPVYGIDRGISISNEPITRNTNGFGVQPVYYNFPLGTTVEIFRNNAYISTQTVTTVPFRADLELIYGVNMYKIVARQPDGNIRTEEVKKSVDSFMLDKGKIEYAGAGGYSIDNKFKYKARVSYGMTNWLTLSTDNDDLNKSASAYIRATEDLLLTPKIYNDGYAGEAYYTHSLFSVSGLYSDREAKERRGIVAFNTFLQPQFTYSQRIMKGQDTQTFTNRLFVQAGKLYLSPFVEYKTVDKVASSATGTNLMVQLPYSLRLTGDVRIQDDNNHRGQLDLIKSLSIGEAKLGASFVKTPHDGFRTESISTGLRIYNWQFASLDASYQYNVLSNSHSAMFSLSGSLTRGGAVKSFQANTGTVRVRAFIDKNQNGKFDGKDELINTTVHVNNTDYKVDGSLVIPDLIPYSDYVIDVDDEIDAEPVNHSFKAHIYRGELVEIEIPFTEMLDLEGTHSTGKDGEKVHLVNTVTGEIIKTTRTRFNGAWYFRVKAGEPVKVVEEQKKQEIAPEPAKPVIKPVEAPKPVKEEVKQPAVADQEEATEGTVEIFYPEQVACGIKEKIASIKVTGKPNRKAIKTATDKIKALGCKPDKVLVWAYDKTKSDALKLAKRFERMVEREGVYVNSIEGFVSGNARVDVRIK